jgi:hypothetical protein
MNNDKSRIEGTTEGQAMKGNQSISQQGQDVTYQQQPEKWLVNGSGINGSGRKGETASGRNDNGGLSVSEGSVASLTRPLTRSPSRRSPSPTPPKQNLWQPKYSALGFVVIALVVVMIDILPRLIRSKLNQATTPKPIELNELESLLVAQLDSPSSDAS